MTAWDRELQTHRDIVAALDSLRRWISWEVFAASMLKRGLYPEIVAAAWIISDMRADARHMLAMMEGENQALMQYLYQEGGES